MLRIDLLRFDDDSSYRNRHNTKAYCFYFTDCLREPDPEPFGQVGLLETLIGFLRAPRLEVIAFIESLLTAPASNTNRVPSRRDKVRLPESVFG